MTEKQEAKEQQRDKGELDPYFTPLPGDNSLETPESISSGSTGPVPIDPSLALKPLRFIKRTVVGLVALLLILATWQSIELLLLLVAIHWLPALLFGLLLLVLTGVATKALLQLFHYKKELRGIKNLQRSAKTMEQARSTGQVKPWLAQLNQLYRGKPQQALLGQALSSLPDYADDAEALRHIDALHLQQLDQQALGIVTRHSQQVALMVALSPVALVDMLLAAWRALRMIDEICQVYAVQPSLPVRLHLLQRVLEQVALAGAAELISGQLAEFASNKLVGMVSTQAASGLGLGLYSARLGLEVMGLCRPIPFPREQKPGFKAIALQLKSAVVGHLAKKYPG